MELAVHEVMSLYGAQALPMEQLIEVILGNGNAAQKLLQGSREPFRALQADIETLKHQGLTDIQSHKIAAVIELIKRFNKVQQDLPKMTCPDEIHRYLRPKMAYASNERFVVLAVNSKNRLIAEKTVSIGSLTCAVVHPREVFKVAVESNAAAIIVAHNHPSGDPSPSREDNEITQILVSAGKVMGIPVLDHIIIGDNQYFSYQEHGKF